jgi:putative intracellular protease/amidase
MTGSGQRRGHPPGSPDRSQAGRRATRPAPRRRLRRRTDGTVASDLLAPYDIFASSPAFRTYVVAADSRPVPLGGGPGLLPTHTSADVDTDPALTPDLVVVPALTDPTSTTEAPLRQWVTTQHDKGARILAVCAGSMVLADTGMLDGLDATSHWSRISALSDGRPAVNWVTGRRWVEDGSVTTTAAVTSGVPASLHLVAELAGPAEAQRVADLHPELDWSPQQTTAISKDRFTAGDWPVELNFVEPWFRPTVGIALATGRRTVRHRCLRGVQPVRSRPDRRRRRRGHRPHPAWPRPAHHQHRRRPVAVPHRRPRRSRRRLSATPLGRRPPPRCRGARGKPEPGRRYSQRRRVHRSAAESRRPHRHDLRAHDSQADRLPDH